MKTNYKNHSTVYEKLSTHNSTVDPSVDSVPESLSFLESPKSPSSILGVPGRAWQCPGWQMIAGSVVLVLAAGGWGVRCFVITMHIQE